MSRIKNPVHRAFSDLFAALEDEHDYHEEKAENSMGDESDAHAEMSDEMDKLQEEVTRLWEYYDGL